VVDIACALAKSPQTGTAGGFKCPALSDLAPCITQSCTPPLDCIVGAWYEIFSSLILSKTRIQFSILPGVNGVPAPHRAVAAHTSVLATKHHYTSHSKPCPALTASAACFVRQCSFTAIDCVVSNWGLFSPWHQSEDKNSNYYCALGPRWIDVSIPDRYSAMSTQLTLPIDCTVTEWGPYEITCSTTCGSGVRRRFRVKHPTLDGGRERPMLISTKVCTVSAPCPKDCFVTQRSAYSHCSASCVSGPTSQTRTVTPLQDPDGKKSTRLC
jgi:hypothetical protein